MLVKNLDVAGGLANGSRGVVTGFDQQDRPIVAVSATPEQPRKVDNPEPAAWLPG